MTTVHTPILSPPVRAVIDAGRILERILERAAPVQLATLLVLDSVAREPGITGTPLAAAVGVSPQTLSGVLNRMERDNLVERQYVKTAIGRVQQLQLTDLGVAKLDECEQKLGYLEHRLKGLIHEASGAIDLVDMLEHFTP